MTAEDRVKAVLAGLPGLRAGLEDLYRDVHQHPELSFAEHRTADIVALRAEAAGYEVTTGVGKTGVVAVLRNGPGPTVLLRADTDALPVAEHTGLPYASAATGVDPDGREVPVMHACGHDMHTTCLIGALDLLASARSAWSGTVLGVFQPAEEVGAGARAMVEDRLYERFGKPEIVLGQHVLPKAAGIVGFHAGPVFSATDALRVRMFGRGAHGSTPEAAIDPVVMAANAVVRLQTVVSREVAGAENAVVTVGAFNSGTKDDIIPDEAELKINIRTFTEPVRRRVLAAVERVVMAEAAASGATKEPEITPIDSFPVLVNDEAATQRTVRALRAVFGADRVYDSGPTSGSEDVGFLATSAGVPICFWAIGCVDPEQYLAAEQADAVHSDIPANHSPMFAPVIQPTLDVGVSALVTAALAWLPGRAA